MEDSEPFVEEIEITDPNDDSKDAPQPRVVVLERNADTAPVRKQGGPRRLTPVKTYEDTEGSFKVCQLNALAVCFARPHQFYWTSNQNIHWGTRGPRIIKLLKRHKADIITLQEVDKYDFFKKHLNKLGYNGRWKKRGKPKRDGTAIFWKRDKFRLVSESSGRLEGFDMKKKWWPQMVLILQLESVTFDDDEPHKPNVYVAATHLKSNCDGHFDNIRTRQAAVLLNHLKDAGATKEDPVVICGDFNSGTDTPLYKMYSTNASVKYIPKYRHEYDLTSVYADGKPGSEAPTYNTASVASTLDYIWYSTKHLEVKRFYSLPHSLHNSRSIPNMKHPSDHYELVAEFYWKKNTARWSQDKLLTDGQEASEEVKDGATESSADTKDTTDTKATDAGATDDTKAKEKVEEATKDESTAKTPNSEVVSK